MVVDASIIHDLLVLIAGKAIGAPQIQAVNHGGEDENGAIKDKPSAREIIAAMVQRGQFAIKDAIAAGKQYGYSKGSMHTACGAMIREKLIQRVGYGAYAIAGKKEKRSKPMRDGSQPQRILAIVRAKQNGSGEGVPLKTIRQELGTGSKNISPSVTDLIRTKQLVRVGKAAYRARAEG